MKTILFNSEMIKAILDGHKTVVRRAVKPQPLMNNNHKPHHTILCQEPTIHFEFLTENNMACDEYPIIPKYNIGDIIYVRKTWQNKSAKIFLRITNIKVERLQDITPCAAKSEGVTIENWVARGGCNTDDSPFYREAFAELWDSTIKTKDLPLYGWNANPWVWVYEFKMEDKMKYVKTTPPCVFKESCGNEICMRENCPDYKPKKSNQPYYGEEEQEMRDKNDR